MCRIRAVTAFALLGLGFGGMRLSAGEYQDPSGFSFTYPDGLVAVTSLNKDTLDPDYRRWVETNHIDLSRMSVSLVHNGKGDFRENLNVVVDPQQLPLEDSSVRKLLDGIPPKYRELGASVENLQGRLQRVGSNRAAVLDYQLTVPGVPFPMRQRQVLFAGGGKTFIVTCTARADTFAEYSATFDTILASFNGPPPLEDKPAGGFDWRRAVMMGIGGGAIGGLVGLFKKLHRGKESKKQS